MKMFKRLVKTFLERAASMLPAKTLLPLLGDIEQTVPVVEAPQEKKPCQSCNPDCMCAKSQKLTVEVSDNVFTKLDLVPVNSSNSPEIQTGFLEVTDVEVPAPALVNIAVEETPAVEVVSEVAHVVVEKPKKARKPRKAKTETPTEATEVAKPKKSRKKKSE